MKTLILLITLASQAPSLLGQSSMPKFTSARIDTMTFLQYLPDKADFVLVYSQESFWSSNTENFKLLAREGNEWTTWTYYRKWKSSSDVYDNKEKKRKKYFNKWAVVDSSSVEELFDSLALTSLWKLSIDSLNEDRGYVVSDAMNYRFQLEDGIHRQILETYAPEYYLKKFPDMQQRILFLQAKEIFCRWWKRNVPE